MRSGNSKYAAIVGRRVNDAPFKASGFSER